MVFFFQESSSHYELRKMYIIFDSNEEYAMASIRALIGLNGKMHGADST